ncbi:MAG: DUF4112 domain-containing protein [Sphingomonadaceae bacterium]
MIQSPRAQAMGFELPTGNDPVSIRKRIEAMEFLLERSFVVPGTGYRFGLDQAIGLVPVLGDIVAAAMGSYLVWEARNLGLPKWKLWRMMGNVGFDALLGMVPVVGDAADFLFRANTRNLKIVKKHLEKHHPHMRVIEQ